MSKGIKRKVLVYSLVSHYIAYVSHDFTNLPPGHHNEPDTLLNCTHITTTAIIPAATGILFQKVISENRIRSGLREVVDSFYENLTAITERDGTLSEACLKYSSDCLQNMIQNQLKHFETVVNVSFLQEIVTFALLKY